MTVDITQKMVEDGYDFLHRFYGERLFGPDKPFGSGTGAIGEGGLLAAGLLSWVHGDDETRKQMTDTDLGRNILKAKS